MGTHAKAEADVRLILDHFRRIVRVLRESSRAAEQRFGLTGAQLFVLQALAQQPSQSLTDLATQTRTHQSTVSVVVSRLVERGLVARTAAADDARRLELTLTRAGRDLVRRSPHAAQERLFASIEGLPARERAPAKLLGALVEAMELSGEEPGMFFDEDTPRTRRRAGS
jgi:DNA-binding MarR family transcriptional regulator